MVLGGLGFGWYGLAVRSNLHMGSLEVGSLHTAPIRAPISQPNLMGVLWELYGRQPPVNYPPAVAFDWKVCGS